MNRVTHFEIYTDDPEAVQPFYQDVFGWKFNKFEGGPIEYWLVTTGDDKDPGINGGITRPREGQSPGTLNTIAVESLDGTIEMIEKRGGKICVPKMAIPKIGWLVQIPFYFLELLVGLVQALVFMLLTAVFTLLICQHEEASPAAAQH